MTDIHTSTPLPPVIAGPILRKVTTEEVHIWLATSQDYQIQVQLSQAENTLASQTHQQSIKVGERLFIQLISAFPEQNLPSNTPLEYQISLTQDGKNIPFDYHPFHYQEQTSGIQFSWRPKIESLLHGSCRKAHFGYKTIDSRPNIGDGLVQADQHLASQPLSQWPSILMLSGDQIYADDVAGPMLSAIRQCITLLGINEERLPDSNQSLTDDPFFYLRESLLPESEQTEEIHNQFFKGKKKPIFTTDTAHNHLITLAEVVVMYLLVWSPELWRHVSLEIPKTITDESHQQRYLDECRAIKEFIAGLANVQRVLAHLPTAMMFDDHDITDDWNLTAEWEQTAYGHALSKRIIGNALFGYFLCQGWGNNPTQFGQVHINSAQEALSVDSSDAHSRFIDELLEFDQWHYHWPTEPKLVVLDTRTHRWRSERNFNYPSGLMDWEAITDLQQEIRDEEAVIMVSPAPIFGVKLIESIQELFTWAGKPLMVDAENWMAHSGSAYALLNVFTHPKTPSNFTVLSGDVHYSFAYDIKLRGIKSSPNIWQITSSGLRNEFPNALLEWFDRLNRWLYAPWSPLNLFTKRRALRITPRKPEFASRGERLLNHSGIGLVYFNAEGQPTEILQLCNNQQTVRFLPSHHSH